MRLGTVVPPEEPEDWTQPLTWLAAAGMLLAPLVAICWFVFAPPRGAREEAGGTWLLATAIIAGGALTGITQRGAWRAAAGTIGAALFAALASVVVGAVAAGGAGIVAPAPSHAAAAAIAGLAGAVAAVPLVYRFASHPRRAWLTASAVVLGLAVAAVVVRLVG